MCRTVSCGSRFICVPAQDHLFTIVYSTFAKSYIIVMRFYFTLIYEFLKWYSNRVVIPIPIHTKWRLHTKINRSDFPSVANFSKLPRKRGRVNSFCPVEGTQWFRCIWDHLRVILIGFFCRQGSRIIQKLPFSTLATATSIAGNCHMALPNLS